MLMSPIDKNFSIYSYSVKKRKICKMWHKKYLYPTIQTMHYFRRCSYTVWVSCLAKDVEYIIRQEVCSKYSDRLAGTWVCKLTHPRLSMLVECTCLTRSNCKKVVDHSAAKWWSDDIQWTLKKNHLKICLYHLPLSLLKIDNFYMFYEIDSNFIFK